MSKKYCSECGSPHDLGVKFCSECGFSFIKKAVNASIPTPVQAPKVTGLQVEEGENGEPERVPDINGLDVDIIKPAVRRQTWGEVFEDGRRNPNPINFKRPKNKGVSKKSAIESLRSEGGASRGSINVGGES